MTCIKVAEPIVGEEEVAAVRKVILSGRYLQGPQVAEFERAFAGYIGTEHGVAVANGTAALHITLAAYGIGPGDEVIVPPLTFFSTVTAVLHQHAIPIFADIDAESYNLDPDDIARKVTERTKAVIPVHLYGNPAEMDDVMAVAEEHNLIVIEDCAQAHGAEYKGRRVGSIGHSACFSFFATKNITTGEGGMILTDDDEIAQRCRLIRSHGMTDRDTHVILGYNFRMTELEAAMGIVQLGRLDELNAARTRNSEYLLTHLGDIPWLKLPRIEPYVKHAYFWCPVQVDEEKLGMGTKELVSDLRERGVEVRHRYNDPLYCQPLLANRENYPLNCEHYRDAPDYGAVCLPNVEQVAGKMIGLPNHPNLTQAQLDRVLQVLCDVGS